MPMPSPRGSEGAPARNLVQPRAQCGSGFESSPTHSVDGFAPYT